MYQIRAIALLLVIASLAAADPATDFPSRVQTKAKEATKPAPKDITPEQPAANIVRPDTLFSRNTPIVQAVKKTRASIVAVNVPREGMKDIQGTGVIVDESGLIVTNRHVVASSAKVNIVLNDGAGELVGEVVHMDASTDLALVRVKTSKKLQALKPAAANDLMQGETVIAIGHPYGYANTVSTGIISAIGREIRIPTGDTLRGLIQHSVPINPGNSGGPLLNINGEFIGVNAALREGAQNIGFAINAGTVEKLLAAHALRGKE